VYSVQYSSKLMQCNACSILYKIYCFTDVAAIGVFLVAVLLFIQPENTANWDAGSSIASVPSKYIYYCTTNHGGCMAVCKQQSHLLHRSCIAVKS